MVANALLVRWAAGWSEETDPTSIGLRGRQEALLGLGAITVRTEMTRVAQAQLAEYATPREEITVGLVPVDSSDQPYLAFTVGDTVTVPDSTDTPAAERVLGIAVAEDDQSGRAIVTPTLKAILLDPTARVFQATKKMINGTLGGTSKVAQPVVSQVLARPRPSAAAPCLTESFDGADSSTVIGHDQPWSRYQHYDSADQSAVPGGFVNNANAATLEAVGDPALGIIASAEMLVDGALDQHATIHVVSTDFSITDQLAVQVSVRLDGVGGWTFSVSEFSAFGVASGSLAVFGAFGHIQIAFTGSGSFPMARPSGHVAAGASIGLSVTGSGTATVVTCYWNGSPLFIWGGNVIADLADHGLVLSDLPETGLRAGFGLSTLGQTGDYAIVVDNFSLCSGS